MVADHRKTKAELIAELNEARERLRRFEARNGGEGGGNFCGPSGVDSTYENLLEALTTPIFYKGTDGLFLGCNKAFEVFLGTDRQAILGRSVFDIYPAEMAKVYFEKDNRLFEAGGVQIYDFMLQTSEGDVRDVVFTKSLFFNRMGEVAGIIGEVADITEKKRLEQAFQESQERYRRLSGATFESVFLSHKGRCIGQNKTAFQMFGYSDEEALGRRGSEWIHPDHRAEVEARIRDGREEPYEVVALRKDGTSFPCEIQGRMVTEGDLHIRITALRDITARKRAEEALRTVEAKYRTYVDNAPLGIFVADSSGRFKDVNVQACRMLGYERDELLAMASEDIDTLGWEVRNDDRALLEDAGMVRVERTLRRKDGSMVLVSLYVVRLDDGLTMAFCSDITKLKRAEDARGESESMFRRTFELSPVGIALVSMDFYLLRANRAYCRMLGRSEEELRELTLEDITHPDDVEENLRLQRQLGKGEIADFRMEKRLIRKDGSIIHGLVVASLIRSHEGEPQFFLGQLLDISEIRKAEDYAKLNEARLTALNALHGMSSGSVEDIADFALESVVALTGSRVGFLSFCGGHMAGDVARRYPPDVGPGTLFEDEAGFWRNAGGLAEPEVVNAAPAEADSDGLGRWMRVPVTDRGRVVLMVGVAGKNMDYEESDARQLTLLMRGMWGILERKKAEEDLRVTLDRLAFHVDNSPLAVIEWKGGTHIQNWSSQAETLFGWRASEVMGRNWRDFRFIHPGDEGLFRRLVQNLFDGTEDYNTSRNRCFHKDGRVIHCHWYNSVLRDETGRVVSILSQVADVSELKRTSSQLIRAKELAEAASRAKSQFLANMSHEIRTPLNGIMGMLQLMRVTDLDDEQDGYAMTAIESCKRLNRLIRDILDLSRVEAGKMRIADEPFDLATSLRSIETLFRPEAERKGIRLVFHINPAIPPFLSGDESRLRQVLDNLTGNAMKFIESGEIAVEVNPLPARRPGECRLLFTVSDTGIGIADDKIGEVFDAFTQVEGDYSRRYQGAGLGLSISKRLVALMNGTMAVSSRLGRGTTFFLCIPFRRVEGGASSEKCLDGLGTGFLAGSRILVADDSRESRVFIEKVLAREGCEVLCAEDGGQALELLRTERLDVAVLDIQMPVLDGVEAIRAIRSSPEFSHVSGMPVIALTAYAMRSDQERFFEAGADECLVKPVEIEDLRRALARVLGKAGNSSAAT